MHDDMKTIISTQWRQFFVLLTLLCESTISHPALHGEKYVIPSLPQTGSNTDDWQEQFIEQLAESLPPNDLDEMMKV